MLDVSNALEETKLTTLKTAADLAQTTAFAKNSVYTQVFAADKGDGITQMTHVYSGSNGKGYDVEWVKTVDGVRYHKVESVGRETHRSHDWLPEKPDGEA